MKRIVSIILLCLLMHGFSLPCFAWFPEGPEFRAESYSEYKDAIESRQLTEIFLPYERVRFLGDFDEYLHYSSDSCRYYLKASNDTDVTVILNDTPDFWFRYHVPSIGGTELTNAGSMLQLNVEAVMERISPEVGGLSIDWVEDFYVCAYGCRYNYNVKGELCSVEWLWEGERYEVIAPFGQYKPDSLLGRIAVEETAADAVLELQLRLSGEYWKFPMILCVCIALGVILGVISAHIIMACKAQNTHRFGGNDENSASA